MKQVGVVEFESTQPESHHILQCGPPLQLRRTPMPLLRYFIISLGKRDNPIKEGCDTCTWCGRIINLGLATTLF